MDGRMRTLRAVLSSAIVILCLGGTGATTHAAAPALAPAVDDDELARFVEDFVRAIDDSRDLLDMFETYMEDGYYGPASQADFERLEYFRGRFDELAQRAQAVSPNDEGDLYAAQTDLWWDYGDVWEELDGFLTSLDEGADDPFADDPFLDDPFLDDPFADDDATRQDVDDPATTTLARRTAALIFEEARFLLALDAFAPGSPGLDELEQLVELVAIPATGGPAELLVQLDRADEQAAEDLPTFIALEPPVGPAVKQTVAPLLPVQRQRVADGLGSPIAADLYLRAIEALLTRNGRPPEPGTELASTDEIANDLRGELMTLGAETPTESSVETPADPSASTSPTDTAATGGSASPAGAAPAAAPDDSAEGNDTRSEPAAPGDGFPILLIAFAAGALVLVAGIAWWARRRRSAPSADRPGFQELLDVSRRLASAESIGDVERLAVQQSIGLTGALAGAYIRHDAGRMIPTFTTDPGLLVAERLADGVLGRVIGSGRELMQISQTEPAIRNLPVSLLAAPVVARATIVGAILLVRAPDNPFDDAHLTIITDLEPIVGGAMESTMLAEASKAEALTDGLTGVRNRRALDAAVDARGDSASFAAVMVDLDHFKSVNDSFGHQGGDDLLRAVAQRISAAVRPGDEVYRYGGEEFAIVLPDTDEPTAADIAERVREAISAATFSIGPDRIEHTATASLGVAAGTGGTTVFARADAALYEAKAAGRDRVARSAVPA